MKLAVMQPYFFPYVGYFQLIKAVDRFVSFDDVNFINRGWINSNRILVNGGEHAFTIPLSKASQNRLINEIELAGFAEWRGKFSTTLEQAYKRAPYYRDAMQVVASVLEGPHRLISELALASLEAVCRYTGTQTAFIRSSSKYGNTALKAQERILDICRLEGASTYVNLEGGTALYSREAFAAKGMDLKFLKAGITPYAQAGGAFIPGLSIIDLLMFNSKESLGEHLNRGVLS